MKKPDRAHSLTDKELAALEKRIAAEYRKAAQEMQGKVDAYFQSFAKRDAAEKAKLDAGKITEQQYKQWRLAQIGRGQRMDHLRDQLAERMTRANEVAAAYINDTTPGIYSLNRNYAAYTIEQVAGDVGFTVWDEQTVKRLIKEQPDLMPYWEPKREVDKKRDLAWGKRQITAQVTTGILQGESIKHISDRLQNNIPDMNRNSAIRAARTAVTGAQNAGRMDSYRAAEQMGIKLRKQWLATLDKRTRHTHQILDGQTQNVDDPFKVDGREIMYPGDPSADGDLVYNCFVGETLVASDSEVVRSYKHEYAGELVKVKTSRGVEFTCTPNHPILTDRGWIAAALLNNGYNLVITSGRNFSCSRRYSNIEHIHSRMKALYNALYRFGFMGRDSTLSVDFHGDIPASNVEVITKKWLLWGNGDASSGKSINKFSLKLPDFFTFGLSHTVKCFFTVCEPAFSLVRRKCKPLSFIRGSLGHPKIHGFRPVSSGDSGVTQNAINDLSAKSETLREFLCGFSGKVALDKVVSVKIGSTWSSTAHVYNLQTKSGYYFVNSSIAQNGGKCNDIFAIAKNCRCTLIADLPDVDTSSAQRRARDPETNEIEIISDMTYVEWMEWKKHGAAPGGKEKTIAGVKRGEPMDFRKADSGSVNPNYGTDFGYSINCQSCVPTFEARQRGYTVQVKPNTPGSMCDELSRKTNLIWIDPTTGDHPDYIYDKNRRTPKKYLEFINSTVKPGERYSIEFCWKGRNHGGHIVNLDRDEQGRLRIFDNQRGEGERALWTGDEEVLQYLSRMKYERTIQGHKIPAMPKLLRIDNMDFDYSVADKIMEAVK